MSITREFILLLAVVVPAHGASEPLRFRNSSQRDIVPTENIVDGTWIVIGNSPKRGGHVIRDTDHPHKGRPVYRFTAADGTVNRIEFCEVFATAENLKGLSEATVANAIAAAGVYLNADAGHFGDTVTYEWSTRFPEPLDARSRAIFAQWHGRPDRTLVADGKTLRHLSGSEFAELLKTVEFREDRCGYDRRTGEKTLYRVDGAAGGPIAAFKIGDRHMFLIARSDASRLSTSEVKLKPKPAHDVGRRIVKGPKEASLVWKLPLSEVPANRWIDFKVRIHYSEYDPEADRVLTQGSVVVWMNGKQVADWKGNIGKNDIHGPYFKFGIYKPGEDGFQVDHAAYTRTIERTRKSPRVPDPLRQ